MVNILTLQTITNSNPLKNKDTGTCLWTLRVSLAKFEQVFLCCNQLK